MVDIRLKPQREGVVSPTTSRLTQRPLIGTVRDRLSSSPYLAVRSVKCVESDDGIRLIGHLPSFYLKQVAQETVLRVESVGRLVNEIEVDAHPISSPRRIFWNGSQSKEATIPNSVFRSRIVPLATAPLGNAPRISIQHKGRSQCSS